MSPVVIHVLLPTDRVQVRQILSDWSHFAPAAVDVALEICDEAACHPFQEYYGYCAKDEGGVAGFVVFGPASLSDCCWDLSWIGVSPRVARQGIGTLLVTYAESVVRGQNGRKIYIETSSLPEFAPARCFYEKMGFSPAARLEDYYRLGADKLIYGKTL